jgi:hypothetical protein
LYQLLEQRLPKTEQPQGGASFEAPALFNPKDSTARRNVAPVRTAEYSRPAGQLSDRVPAQHVSRQQVLRDAAGWKSASE